ncbi:hypothetical protein AQI88_11360 [Streptomyces cellostaticus]|uniref:Serine/arginine repetitive matrix protein 2 n=1 Tax=Streptomyces cellostaticus TaxID=67285 RepID=A0A101NNW6_9ACTN|nr:hypothetical protein [Streptomyces cellostaticus]KUM96720.1 hypothetical protein AQI88_11360 [Streptomyces cellostaticus]GHI05488.1 hypothetical protein Scel_38090 [Streptomyces cellostaticus]
MSGRSGWSDREGKGEEGVGSDHGPGADHAPGEERGRAAWTADESVTPPPWASAQTRSTPLPPPWASAETSTAMVPPAPGGADVPPPPQPWATAHASAGGPPAPAPVPLPSYAPVPAPRRIQGGRLIALIVAMVLVGAGSGFGVWYLGRDRGGSGSPSASAPATDVTVTAPTSSVGTTPPPSPSSTPSASGGAPAGYRLVHDPVGYTLAVPEGWTRRQKQGEKETVVFYDSPSDGRQLQIFELSETTVTESLDLAENDPGYGYSREPGYRALARRSGDTWAELSYRYDDRDKGARRVVDHRFQAADGTLYAIRSSGPERLSDDRVRAPLTTALAAFCATDASCAQGA